MIYFLIITDNELSYNNYSEDFLIGVFKIKVKAIEVGKYYIKNIDGFSQYPCTYAVKQKEVLYNGIIENIDALDSVWIVIDWNVNEHLDEIEIVESYYLLTKDIALEELEKMRSEYKRTEWCIDNYKVNELYWQDGFQRR